MQLLDFKLKLKISSSIFGELSPFVFSIIFYFE